MIVKKSENKQLFSENTLKIFSYMVLLLQMVSADLSK